jgi:hypothetical protein
VTTKQQWNDFPDVQAAIYRVALSLDAFLLNGIQYGLLHRASSNDFLKKTAGNLLRDLASLEEQALHAPGDGQPRARELLAALRAACHQVIDLVTGLSSFRALSLDQLRSVVSQISPLREVCVQQIQELEGCFQTPTPFYESRPAGSVAAVSAFLANLERAFVDEWTAAREQEGGHSVRSGSGPT